MAIFDIFSTSFLFSIAIILLICGSLFIYFNCKIDKQNHKLTSMVNLVAALAEDLQFVKNQINKNVDNNLQYSSQIQMINKINSDLISVSDVENNDDDDEDDDDEDAEGTEDDDDEDDDDDDDDAEDDDAEGTEDNNDFLRKKYPFKPDTLTNNTLTNNTLTNDTLTNDTLINDTLINDTLINNTLTNDFKEVTNNQLFDEIKTIHLENPISFQDTNMGLSTNLTNHDISFLKDVNITDFEDVEDLQGSYKKMSLNKLREIIVSKGVVSDASKLKKNEILKMLEPDFISLNSIN